MKKTKFIVSKAKGDKPTLLSGGNPQIAKADGRCPCAGIYRGYAGLEE